MIMPNDINIEQSIISSLLINHELKKEIEFLKPEHFYNSANYIIYKAMLEIEQCDLLLTTNKLKEMGNLELIGGASTLVKILDTCPFCADIVHHALKLVDLANLRTLAQKASNIINQVSRYENSASEIVSDAQKSILEITFEDNSKNLIEIKDSMLNTIEDLDNGNADGLSLGYNKLNYMITFGSGELLIIGARPKMGKTSFARNILKNIAYKQNISVGFFSLEIEEKKMNNSLITMETGISIGGINELKKSISYKILNPNQKEQHKRILDAANNIAKWPVVFDYQAYQRMSELRRKIRLMKKKGVKVVIIDQLNKLITDKRSKDQFSNATECVMELKKILAEEDMRGILLAQLNRDLEKRAIKRPVVSDFKNTGSLEEEPEAIILIYREYVYTEKEEDINKAEIIVGANRSGDVGSIPFHWNKHTTTFSEIDNTYSEPTGKIKTIKHGKNPEYFQR